VKRGRRFITSQFNCLLDTSSLNLLTINTHGVSSVPSVNLCDWSSWHCGLTGPTSSIVCGRSLKSVLTTFGPRNTSATDHHKLSAGTSGEKTSRRKQEKTRWKVLWESTTPRESLPNGAAFMGPFQHLGTTRSPTVGTINHHHACDAWNVNNRRFTDFLTVTSTYLYGS